MKMAMEIGPKKMGLTIKACFPDATFLLFKNAASSNKHHNLCVHVGSQRINIASDFLSSPAKLKIAWAFRSSSCWLIQILSKKILFRARQRSMTKVVTRKPEGRHHIEKLPSRDPRSQPGRRSKSKRIIIKIATKKPLNSAAKPLYKVSSVRIFFHCPPCQEWLQKVDILSLFRLL